MTVVGEDCMKQYKRNHQINKNEDALQVLPHRSYAIRLIRSTPQPSLADT